MKDEELPPLQLEIDWDEPPELAVSVISNPDEIELGMVENADAKGVMLYFPKAKKGLVFEADAQLKLLFLFDSLIHGVLASHSSEAGEASEAKKKKVTLH